jgi:nitroimidazol reductase NimA-like FMN-containing flavoprotein (pyridoxamine 5'-phosphate oxidase superfamily)
LKEIRRKDRALQEEEGVALLTKAEFGVLSTSSSDGEPYGVPISYCIINTSIYFHSAMEGHKIDNINTNKSVSFCVVGKTEILPDSFGTKYESVIVSGRAEEVFEQEKQDALEGLLHKYCSEFIDNGKKYIDAMREKTKVFKIAISKI